MRARRAVATGALGMTLLACMLAAAEPAPPRGQPAPERPIPRPFGRGTFNVGGALGFGAGEGGFAFTVGLNFGYFVLAGLEPGIYGDFTLSGDSSEATVLPYLRWIFWRNRRLSPYLKVQGGGLFIIDYASLGMIGGGGGVVIGFGSSFGINLEGLVYRLLPESKCPAHDCMRYGFGVSLGYFFGGSRPPRRPPRPPAPSPDPAPAPVPSESPTAPAPVAPPESAPTSQPATDEPGR